MLDQLKIRRKLMAKINTKSKANKSKAILYNGWKIYKDRLGAFVAGRKLRKGISVTSKVASGASLAIVKVKIDRLYRSGYKDVR
jgi:hypothetical protein